MVNYLRSGGYLESYSGLRDYGDSGPSNLTSTFDGNISDLDSYVYAEQFIGVASQDPALAIAWWDYWFDPDQDGSYSIFVDSITVYWKWRVRGPWDKRITYHITVSRYTSSGWDALYVNSRTWNVSGSGDSGNDDYDREEYREASFDVNAFASMIRVRLYIECEPMEPDKSGTLYVWAYNRETEVLGESMESGLRFTGGDGLVYRLAAYAGSSEAPAGESGALRYGDSEGIARRFRLVPEDDDKASPLRVEGSDGTYSIAFFGRYS